MWTNKEKEKLVESLFKASKDEPDGKKSLSFDKIADILEREGNLPKEKTMKILNSLKPSTTDSKES